MLFRRIQLLKAATVRMFLTVHSSRESEMKRPITLTRGQLTGMISAQNAVSYMLLDTQDGKVVGATRRQVCWVELKIRRFDDVAMDQSVHHKHVMRGTMAYQEPDGTSIEFRVLSIYTTQNPTGKGRRHNCPTSLRVRITSPFGKPVERGFEAGMVEIFRTGRNYEQHLAEVRDMRPTPEPDSY
ncbi:MAG: hypothetical protein AB203_01140 [Parcubacteria bacterium C7867-008]|nr:MAG: hypothetical protein AB203_01140 [Parcubacteria bacterium C7867-008]